MAQRADSLASDASFIDAMKERIRHVYRSREAVWLFAFSGGRDSTAALQLVWQALAELPAEQRTNPVEVLNVATGVDSVVAHAWVERSLLAIDHAAEQAHMPLEAARLRRELADSFWVKLIGHGLAPPRPDNLWCVEGLKRRPVERRIRHWTSQGREVVLVLGAREEQRAYGSRVLALRAASVDGLRRYAYGAQALVYMPLAGWSTNDVHTLLSTHACPWGVSNADLLEFYSHTHPERGSVELPDAPMCGDCRVGCWVCTVFPASCSFDELLADRPDLHWLGPLVELRCELIEQRGPHAPRYSQEEREYWLRRVLEVQRQVGELLGVDDPGFELISLEELREIRRIWCVDNLGIDDRLPLIFSSVLGQPFADATSRDDAGMLEDDLTLLRAAFGDDTVGFHLSHSLLAVEQEYRTMLRRAGIFEALEEVFGRQPHDAASSDDQLPPGSVAGDAKTKT